MKKLSALLVACGLLAGAYFLLQPHVVWLDGFDGVVVAKIEEDVATVSTAGGRNNCRYFLDVETDSGRLVHVPVEQLTYFDAQEGMRVHKATFSSGIELKSLK